MNSRHQRAKLLLIFTGVTALAGTISYWTSPVPAPSPVRVPTSQPVTPKVGHSPIAEALLASNARYAFTDGVARRGFSTIHRLDVGTASRVEHALHKAADRTGLPVSYLAGFVLQESTGDPRAEFRNPTKWEAAQDDRERFATTDHGLVQISGRNLLEKFPMLTLGELKAKAEDVEFAVDFLADYVVADLDWISSLNLEALDDIDKTVMVKAANSYWLAALAYNRGRPGALKSLSNPRGCKHADLVIEAWARVDAKTAFESPESIRAPIFAAAPEDDPRRLAMGDIGLGVEALQRLLNDRLAPGPPLKVDGNFGPATRDALIRFQKSRVLEPTGATDTRTWEALMGLGMKLASEGPSPLVMGDAGPQVQALQRQLNDRVTPSPALKADGKFGAATRDALIRFQRSQGIAPTGAADTATYEALNSRDETE